MCEAKPGPRCSADTLRVLKVSSGRVTSAIQELHELENRNVNGGFAEQVNVARNNLMVAEEQLRNDTAVYHATPEGFKELELQISQGRGRSKMVREGMFVEDGDWVDVSFKEDAGYAASVELKVAKDHREWQVNASKHLNALKQEGADAHRLELEGGSMRQQLLYSRERVREVLIGEREKYAAALKDCVDSGSSVESVRKLKDISRRVHYYDTYLTYANIRANDIDDFVNAQRRAAGV